MPKSEAGRLRWALVLTLFSLPLLGSSLICPGMSIIGCGAAGQACNGHPLLIKVFRALPFRHDYRPLSIYYRVTRTHPLLSHFLLGTISPAASWISCRHHGNNNHKQLNIWRLIVFA
jgi:hypothetical protein